MSAKLRMWIEVGHATPAPCRECGTRVKPEWENCVGCGWAVVAPDSATVLDALQRGARGGGYELALLDVEAVVAHEGDS